MEGIAGMSALSASPEVVSPPGTGPEALSGARAAGRDPSDDSAGAKPDVRPGGMVGASSDGAIVPDGLASRTGAGERASGRGEGPVEKAGASRTGRKSQHLGSLPRRQAGGKGGRPWEGKNDAGSNNDADPRPERRRKRIGLHRDLLGDFDMDVDFGGSSDSDNEVFIYDEMTDHRNDV